MLERRKSSLLLGRRRRRSVIGAAGAVALVGTLVGPAQGQQIITPPSAAYQPITVHSHEFDDDMRWGERTEVAGDQDDQGINDVWMGVPSYDRDNHLNFGKVYLMDGKFLVDPQGNKDKGKPIAEINHPEQQDGSQFGFWVENPGNLNPTVDNDTEVVIGTDAQHVPWDPTENSQICDSQPERCNQNQGKAWVFRAKTHDVMYELNNPRPQGSGRHRARFGSRIGTAGDVNGNGINDIIVGASGNDNPEGWYPTNGGDGCSDDGVIEANCRSEQGQAFIFEGANGTLIRELNMPPEDQVPTPCDARCGNFGLAVQGVGDVDGDGVIDQQVAAPSWGANGRIYIFSGATGLVIRKIDPPQPVTIFFGFQDVDHLDPGDVNGDGFADIYGADFFSSGETGPGQGKAWVFPGGPAPAIPTNVPLYEVKNPDPGPGRGFSWSMTRDRNREQSSSTGQDFDPGATSNPMYVGNAPHHIPNCNQQGNTYAFNPQTGTHLQTLPLPPPWNAEPGQPCNSDNPGPNLGWTVSSPGDLNGDGFREFIAGAPFTDVCETINGANNTLNVDQGVLIVFRSSPLGDTTPVYSKNSPTNECPAETG